METRSIRSPNSEDLQVGGDRLECARARSLEPDARFSFVAARFLLGLGQSFNTPAGMKALAEWVPQRERGLSSAVFSNANSLGGVLAPPIVATLALWLGFLHLTAFPILYWAQRSPTPKAV